MTTNDLNHTTDMLPTKDGGDVIPDVPEGYAEFLRDIKAQIKSAQVDTALTVSRKMTALYWRIGREILRRQEDQGWGAKIITRLAVDLHTAFPEMEGFSPRNLKYMRAFAEAYSNEQIVQQLLHNSAIPWGHQLRILDKVKDTEQRLWYIRATHQNGWSRAVLEHQIATDLYGRQGKTLTNFDRTLPPPQSDLAQQVLKDPYNFDFLTLASDANERHLERGLLEHLRAFLLEMGAGFAFVGSQYHLEVGGKDYYLDLLFYHLRLRCFVVVDLKMGAFQPEFAGKMNFYLSAVDDLLKHSSDAPTIGLILCRERDGITVEYALRNTSAPIGVAEFIASLPADLQASLPTVQQIEAELAASDILG